MKGALNVFLGNIKLEIADHCPLAGDDLRQYHLIADAELEVIGLARDKSMVLVEWPDGQYRRRALLATRPRSIDHDLSADAVHDLLQVANSSCPICHFWWQPDHCFCSGCGFANKNFDVEELRANYDCTLEEIQELECGSGHPMTIGAIKDSHNVSCCPWCGERLKPREPYEDV